MRSSVSSVWENRELEKRKSMQYEELALTCEVTVKN